MLTSTKVFIDTFRGNSIFGIWNVDLNEAKIGQYPIMSFGKVKAHVLIVHITELILWTLLKQEPTDASISVDSKVFIDEFKGNKIFAIWKCNNGVKFGDQPIISFGIVKAKALVSHIKLLCDWMVLSSEIVDEIMQLHDKCYQSLSDDKMPEMPLPDVPTLNEDVDISIELPKLPDEVIINGSFTCKVSNLKYVFAK